MYEHEDEYLTETDYDVDELSEYKYHRERDEPVGRTCKDDTSDIFKFCV